jgi:23S rRNA (uridine2552-2'-O)-methyltransferase
MVNEKSRRSNEFTIHHSPFAPPQPCGAAIASSMAYNRKDHFYRQAKNAGYRSRAAYKLLELAQRHRLITAGDHVVDLGAWPGGWLQVAAELVGDRGRVIGVDLVGIEPIPKPVIACVQGDATTAAVQEEIRRRAGGRVDVVLSDMAPKLTGIRATDTARAGALADAAADIAARLLRPGGRLLVKVFTSAETDALVARLKQTYATVKRTRPEASRVGSAELYVIAIGYRPPSDTTPRMLP